VKYNKIRISGPSGSGKTYLGRLLEKKTRIPFTLMDTLFFDLSKRYEFTKNNCRSLTERNKLISNVLNKKQWILDGAHFTSTTKTYDEADVIIYLAPPLLKRTFNILKRFFRRLREGRCEPFLNFIRLVWYNLSSKKKWIIRKTTLKEKYREKVHIFSSADEAYKGLITKQK